MVPRTYCVAAGSSLLLGGLARIDLVTCPSRTIYLTIWASDLLPLHVGKTESAEERYERFVGRELVPPSAGAAAIGRLEPLKVCPRCFSVAWPATWPAAWPATLGPERQPGRRS